ncbi:MAG: hypothetical protein KY476_00510 [Planctomycetes bacterium]|nr:hypothetical protein [Planctomycetota bacterium]
MPAITAIRTQEEVARILTERGEPITKGGVFMAEQTALRKLRSLLAEFAPDDWVPDEDAQEKQRGQ